jgi:hypothetical protein
MQNLLDYIDLIRPSLKEQVCNLSNVLLQIIDNQLPPRRLVLETLTSNLAAQLRNRSLEELFQFDTDIFESHQADAVVSPPSDQMCLKVQIVHSDYTTESSQWQSNTADYSESTYSSECHGKSDYLQELDQQSNGCIEDPSCLQDESGHNGGFPDSEDNYIQDVDRSAQPQSGHNGGFLNSQDNYIQDVDWRAQKPFDDWEGESPDSQDGDLRRSDQSEAGLSDMELFLNYSPQNIPGIASTSVSASISKFPSQNLVSMPVQLPRASTHHSTGNGVPDLMIWTVPNGNRPDSLGWTVQDHDAAQ